MADRGSDRAVTVTPGLFLPAYTSFYIEDGSCGVQVICLEPLPFALDLGDSVRVHGGVGEAISSTTGAGARTEVMASVRDVHIVSTGNSAPIPTDMDVASLQAEENEGRLLRTSGKVVSTSPPWSVEIWDSGASLVVHRGDNESVSLAGLEVGDYIRVAGVLSQRDTTSPYLGGYELMPRFQGDIDDWTPVSRESWGAVKAIFSE